MSRVVDACAPGPGASGTCRASPCRSPHRHGYTRGVCLRSSVAPGDRVERAVDQTGMGSMTAEQAGRPGAPRYSRPADVGVRGQAAAFRVVADAVERSPAGPARPPPGRPAGAPQRPGGCGKTTLLGQWLATRPPAAWVTLDARDDGAGSSPTWWPRCVLAPRRRPGDAGPAAPARRGGPRRPGAALAEDLAALDGRRRRGAGRLPGGARRGVHAALDALLRHPRRGCAWWSRRGPTAAAAGPAARAGPAGGAARRRPALHPRRGGRLPGPRPPRHRPRRRPSTR